LCYAALCCAVLCCAVLFLQMFEGCAETPHSTAAEAHLTLKSIPAFCLLHY